MNLPDTFDPVVFGKIVWPDNTFYDRQCDMIYGVRDSSETCVVGCNGSGKDHTSGYICATMFIAPWLYYSLEYVRQVQAGTPKDWPMRMRHTRRIFTTSASEEHLRVLWAEMGKWLSTSKIPLLVQDGGDLVLNDLELRFKDEMHLKKPPNYMIGGVAAKPEKFSGHHARYTLAVGDEASGLGDVVDERFSPWAKRRLYIGNAERCENFYRKKVQQVLGKSKSKVQGTIDVLPEDGVRGIKYYSTCLRLRAEDSPNVVLAVKQKERGETPTNDIVTMGVVTWSEYVDRRKNLHPMRQSVVLDSVWYEGASCNLIDPDWFTAANAYGALPWDGRGGRRPPPVAPFYLGIDCAEGGDDTSWVLIDRHGVLKIVSLKTADTNVIYGRTIDFMREHKVDASNVLFDRGGGGKQCADRLRAAGYAVRTVSFGTIKNEPQRAMRLFGQKKETVEQKDEAKSRRSEMYLDLRGLLEIPLQPGDVADPIIVDALNSAANQKPPLPNRARFALPLPMCEELIRELACVPLRYDELGRFDLIPKQKDKKHPDDPEDQNTFRYLIGRSPDIADAFALAVHGMEHKPSRGMAGVS